MNFYCSSQGTGEFYQGPGTVVSNSGFLLVAGESVNSAGTYTMSNALLVTVGDATIGKRGQATFTQVGGTNRVGGDLIVGDTGGNGTYEMRGGLCRANDVTVREDGTSDRGTICRRHCFGCSPT